MFFVCVLILFCFVRYQFKRRNMDLPIKIEVDESADHFILSTRENETLTGSSHLQYTKNGIIISNELFKTEIKQESVSNDVDNSEYEEEYLDEDSETEHTKETSQTHSCSEPGGCKKGRERTTPAQVQKLFDFMNNIAIRQPDSDDALRILIDELNAIGPPIRTSAQWRRTLSILKYNHKRKRQAVLGASERSKRMRLDHNEDADATNSTTHDTNDEYIRNTKDHFHSQILKKMDLVLEQQTKQTSQLEKLNTNLAKLIDVLTEKIT